MAVSTQTNAPTTDWLGTLFPGYSLAQPYGAAPAGLYDAPGYQDVEKGVVLSGSGAIRLPTTAIYSAEYSGPYESIFNLPTGGALDFMHIDAARYANGQTLPAGTVVGTTGPAGSYSETTLGGLTKTMHNSANVVEVGLYDTAADAFQRDTPGDPYNPNGSVNPVPWFTALAGGVAPNGMPTASMPSGGASTGGTVTGGTAGTGTPLLPSGVPWLTIGIIALVALGLLYVLIPGKASVGEQVAAAVKPLVHHG